MSESTTIASPRLPAGRGIRLGVSRIGYEVRLYFRQADTVFFTFLFPLVMLTIFAVAFSETNFGPPGEEISAAAYYLPAMLAAGVLLSGLQNLSIDIAMERSDGTLKRLAGTPLPVVSYFMGKIGQALVTGILQAGLLLLVAAVALRGRAADRRRVVDDLRVGVPARRDDVRDPRHRAEPSAALRQERDSRDHPDRADPAVHLGHLHPVQQPAGLAAEHREPLPAQVARTGDALGVPARIVRRRANRAASGTSPGSRSPRASGWSRGSILARLTFRWIRKDA